MMPFSEIIFSGFVSKVVNDVADISRDKIRRAGKNRDTKHQNIESQIYGIIVDVLNRITGNVYEDEIYDAAEVLLKSFIKNEGERLGNIKSCLRFLNMDADEGECLEFEVSLYEELGREEYSELFRAVLLLLLDQKNWYEHAVYEQLTQKLDEVVSILNRKRKEESNNFPPKVRNRVQEYAKIWNSNMFLNNFDKRDENAGVNVKLNEVYLEKHLPHYVWGNNQDTREDLKDLLSDAIYACSNKMLLVLGQPGIGKSTLITWITANYTDRVDSILVYKFASDLGNVDWKTLKISNTILEELCLSYDELNEKILILDGFDEVNVGEDRERILDRLYEDLIYNKAIKNFSLIITCRENCIKGLERMKCNYITLKSWNRAQIESFYNIFQEKTGNRISEITMKKLVENKETLGIPLILYMVLSLNILIDQEGSIVDVYDKIFSLEGGVYDRCIDNKKFAEKHRIGEVKEQIHQISREIAMWMFENKRVGAYIPKEEYQKICADVMQEQKNKDGWQDFLIGNYFKLVRHCEGVETEELYFVHRSIYEYFVAETIFSAIENAMIELSAQSEEELAGNIAFYLKKGEITYTIGEYLQHKIFKLYNKLDNDKKRKFYQWWESAVCKMMERGMFYFTERSIQDYKSIMDKEINSFLNLVIILRLLLRFTNNEYILGSIYRDRLTKWIKYCLIDNKNCDFSSTNLYDTDFCGAYLQGILLCKANLQNAFLSHAFLNGANLEKSVLKKAYLVKTNLNEANLSEANLMEAVLFGAALKKSNLIKANLNKADLREASLRNADLRGAVLIGANIAGMDIEGANIGDVIFDEGQIANLEEQQYCLKDAKVYVVKSRDVISYKDYCKRKQ